MTFGVKMVGWDGRPRGHVRKAPGVAQGGGPVSVLRRGPGHRLARGLRRQVPAGRLPLHVRSFQGRPRESGRGDPGDGRGSVGACVVTEPCAAFVCLCRYEGTGPYWMPQRWYKCKSCTRDEVGVDGGVGLCSSCARSCHEGHELVEQEYSPFYCDCPLGGFPSILCRKRRQPKVASNTTEAASIS